jgi:cytochrome b561
MANQRQAQNWTVTDRVLHWSMAFLVLLQGALGWVGSELERSPLKVDVLTAHKSLGIALLLLVLFRLSWRLTNPAPAPVDGSRTWEIRAAWLSHSALYLLMMAVPLSGWLSAYTSVVPSKPRGGAPSPDSAAADQQLHEFAKELHEALIWCLVIILVVHVAAALWHHFVKRDEVLRRMLRG